MIEDKNNVPSAFEMLLEEVEAEINFVVSIENDAKEERDYDKAKEAKEHSDKIEIFRDRVAILRRDWIKVFLIVEQDEDEDTRVKRSRRNLGKLCNGLRTPQQEFYLPILQVLVDMGGSGKMSNILSKVELIMKSKLSSVDYQVLESGGILRWYNTGQWARNDMRVDRLIRDDSPRGVWEITNKGREFLNNPPGFDIKRVL